MEQQDSVAVRGMFRVRIVNEDGSFAGDSGWFNNNIMNEGFRQYLVMALGSISGSKYISHLALGTGGTVATDQTAMAGEVGTRTAVTASSTVAGSLTLALLATFAAGWHTSGVAHNISQIGAFNSVSGGTAFAVQTFASSSCASNQAVQATHSIVFSRV
jgi:hypothetical protein